jgi:hypothetical protein
MAARLAHNGRIDSESFPPAVAAPTKVKKAKSSDRAGALDSSRELQDHFSRISIKKIGAGRFYFAESLSPIIRGLCADPFAGELPPSFC